MRIEEGRIIDRRFLRRRRVMFRLLRLWEEMVGGRRSFFCKSVCLSFQFAFLIFDFLIFDLSCFVSGYFPSLIVCCNSQYSLFS